MAGQINRPCDEHREIRVHFDQAVGITFVPVIGTPDLIIHVGDVEAFIFRQRNVGQRARTGFSHRRLKHGVQLGRRNFELAVVSAEALIQIAVTRHLFIQLRQRGVQIIRCQRGTDCIVQSRRFFIERQEMSLQLADIGGDGCDMLFQIDTPFRFFRRRGGHRRDCLLQLSCRCQQITEAGLTHLLLPFCRTGVGVDIAGIMFTDCQCQADIVFCDFIQSRHADFLYRFFR